MRVVAKPPGKYGIAAMLAAMALLVAVAPSNAQRAVPESAVAMKQSFAPVVKKAAPTVVNVYVRHQVEQMVSPFFDDPFFGRLFGERFGIPRERIQNSLGSGVLVGSDGVVVTTQISPCFGSTPKASSSRRSSSAIPTASRWAISCWPSATRSGSARR